MENRINTLRLLQSIVAECDDNTPPRLLQPVSTDQGCHAHSPLLKVMTAADGAGESVTIITIVIISIALYLTDKGEHTALYKINKGVSIKTSEIMINIVIILYKFLAHHTCTHTHTHMHACMQTCVCFDGYICVCADGYICVCIDRYICVCIDRYICVCIDGVGGIKNTAGVGQSGKGFGGRRVLLGRGEGGTYRYQLLPCYHQTITPRQSGRWAMFLLRWLWMAV